ncbi:MAG: SDR family oxidoreductase [Ruminococcaceae bacterium]|nr:SDR family oxidoreductase [Oscillospiraceae bacterium]
MKILVTGAKGFVGKNLCENLKNIKDGKNRCYPELKIGEIYEADVDTADDILENYCKGCDFVFHLAGVNRPQNNDEFTLGNVNALEKVLGFLKFFGNKAPIMLSSSIQASGVGRYKDSPYGESKLKGEELLFSYSEENTVPVFVYRFPNLFGKWCRPNYNSAVATFCNNIANGLPITVSDPAVQLELLYIDDLVSEMINCLLNKEHRCEYNGVDVVPTDKGKYSYAPVTHKVTLGEITELLYKFKNQPSSLLIPEIPDNSFAKKLYSTYLSYLPENAVSVPLKMNVDSRGSFTELIKTEKCGQFSVNISKPGITKGQHWHNSKWEIFVVVSGHGLIQLRKIGSDEIIEFEVSGEKIEAVYMLPGYTHNIINLSDTDDLVTFMWANESFDPAKPDTYGEPV